MCSSDLQANQDIEKILTSSERIAARGNKIENLDFEDDAPKAVEGATGPSIAAPSPDPVRPEPLRNGGARIVRQPDLLAKES